MDGRGGRPGLASQLTAGVTANKTCGVTVTGGLLGPRLSVRVRLVTREMAVAVRPEVTR
jgi:hypothetical protein